MKKIILISLSVVCILSLLCISCFATGTTVTTTDILFDNTIKSYKVIFNGSMLHSSTNYNLLSDALYQIGAVDPSTAIGKLNGTIGSSGNHVYNYPFYTYHANHSNIAVGSLNPDLNTLSSITYFEIEVNGSVGLDKFMSISGANVYVNRNGYISSGVSNSISIIGNVIKYLTNNQYTIIFIGLACGTFFVSFAIYKTKSLIKGY